MFIRKGSEPFNTAQLIHQIPILKNKNRISFYPALHRTVESSSWEIDVRPAQKRKSCVVFVRASTNLKGTLEIDAGKLSKCTPRPHPRPALTLKTTS